MCGSPLPPSTLETQSAWVPRAPGGGQRRREKRAAERAADTGTTENITEYVIEKPAGEQTGENDVIKSGEKENNDSIEKVKEVSATNPPDLKLDGVGPVDNRPSTD